MPEVDSGVAAFSEADGRLLWRKGPPKTEPLQAELEVSDALPNWPGQPHGIDVAAVALDAERAYVARTNWLLASYALLDGQLLWAVRVPDRASLHLAVQGSRLFMGAEGSLYVYDAEDGTALDVIDLANAIGPVLRDGDSLYLITAHPEKSILSIDARSLEVLWSRTAPVAVPGYENTLTSSDGKLYLSGERIAAYDLKDGDLLWQTAPGGPYGQAVPMASMLFVRENGPKLVVIDATNGELKGALRLQTNDPFGCLSSRNPASTASLLIVPFGDERVLAYRTAP